MLAIASSTAIAGPALDEGAATPAGADGAPAASDPTVAVTKVDPDAVDYGVAVRLRNTRIPQGLYELGVDRAAGGSSNIGLGVELIRRRGNVELQLGFEFEHITPTEGVWINKNEPVPAYEADFLLDPEHAPDGEKLGWFTIEFTFLNHAPINKTVAVRYGGGAGLGIFTGALYRYDVACTGNATNSNPEPGCRPSVIPGGQGSGRGPVKYDLPPVFPVVNAILGLQIKPADKLVINIEGGLRTMPFFGTSIGYFF